MTLNKTDLVNSVIEKVRLKKQEKERQQYLFPEFNYTPLSKKKATDIVNSTLRIMMMTLERGEHVLISGFGKFQVKFQWARKWRNPSTGENNFLKSRRKVVFKASSKLKERINQKGEGS